MLDVLEYVRAHGGATLSARGEPITLKTGYMVSLKGSETRIAPDAPNAKAIIAAYLAAANRGVYCGLWLYEGVLYIDRSVRIARWHDAEAFGNANAQIAVYDNARRESVTLNPARDMNN